MFHEALLPVYDEQEIDSFFSIILEKIHQLKRIDLALQPETEMTEAQTQQWNEIVSDLQKQKPIQYILGETEFYGLSFLVNESVLIPRPETEELVEIILSNNRITASPHSLRILDIGTGSGCIPIALAKNIPNAEVFAIDVSEEALAVAKKNAERNKVNVTFIKQNILEVVTLNEVEGLEQTFDIIVSNPPYVRNLEKAEIKPNVLDYEPHLALFVEDTDALLFYRKITELATKALQPNGQLYFEINQYLGAETVALVQSYGFATVQLIKDVYGNDRMIRAAL